MKKLIKFLTCVFSFILLVASTFGCVDEVVIPEERPDYSNSNKEAKIWAYEATVNDWYQVNGVRYYFEQGMITSPETMALYKDGNFNILFINYNFQYNSVVDGENPFQGTDVEYVMDLAQEEGLPCFVFHNALHSLGAVSEPIINKDKALIEINREVPERSYYFDTYDYAVTNGISESDVPQSALEAIDEEKAIEEAYDSHVYGRTRFYNEADLDRYVALCLRGLKDHPAFRGVSLKDEPTWDLLEQLGVVYRSIVRVCNSDEVTTNDNPYVMMNMLPYNIADYHKVYFAENGNSLTSEEAYARYLEKYYECIGQYCGYFQYDDYPILEDKGMWSSYIRAHQMVSDFCKEKGLERRMVMQTCSYSQRRAPLEGDMWFQSNLSQAFGNKDFSYYTYNPTTNTSGSVVPDGIDTIVDRYGRPNERYNWVKAVNEEILFNSKALMNFEYVGMTYDAKAPMPGGMSYVDRLEKNDMTKLKGFTYEVKLQSGGMVLITELYDKENNQYGYYVVNATNPGYTSEIVVTLDFGEYDYVQVYQASKVSNAKTNDGKITVHLGTGRGAFVMPF